MKAVREAVILAAGEGSRLKPCLKDMPKFLLKILGKPLISYPLTTLINMGVEKIVVVVPKGWGKVLNQIVESFDAEFKVVENQHVERENGYSFLLSEKYVEEDLFFLSMCDHIYPTKLIRKLLKSIKKMSEAIMLVAGDKKPKYIDIHEATKIKCIKDKVIKIGKRILDYNYIDSGVFLVKKTFYEVARELAKIKRVIKLSDIINYAIEKDKIIRVANITGTAWTEIDTPKDLKELLYGKRRKVLKKVMKERKR